MKYLFWMIVFGCALAGPACADDVVCTAKIKSIQPGVSQADIEKVLSPDGGLQTSDDIRYIVPDCACEGNKAIKIDIRFEDGIAVGVSKTYCEYMVAD